MGTTRSAAVDHDLQRGFTDSPHYHSFQRWHDAFTTDVANLRQEIRTERDTIEEIVEEGRHTAITARFARSIDPGVKGLALSTLIIKGHYSLRQRILAPGMRFLLLTLGADRLLAREGPVALTAAGYGGRFLDGEREVEVFYVKPAVFSGKTLEQIRADGLYGKSFPKLKLPALGVIERDVWPVLLFTRSTDGTLRLYALSREYDALLARFHPQRIE